MPMNLNSLHINFDLVGYDKDLSFQNQEANLLAIADEHSVVLSLVPIQQG